MTSENSGEWGESAILFGSLDPGLIVLIGGIGSLIAWPILGPIGSCAIAIATGNDWLSATKNGRPKRSLAAGGQTASQDLKRQVEGGKHQVEGRENLATGERVRESETRSLSVIQMLQGECKSLLPLINGDPIRIVGAQRTGKTSLARIIVLLRELVFEDHVAIATSPDHEQRGWPECFQVFGHDGEGDRRGGDAIANQWQAMAHRCDQGGALAATSYCSTLWDEFARIDETVDPGELSRGIKRILCAASKNRELPIFICHGEQANFGLPGVENFVTSFLARTVRVETFGDQVVEEGTGLPKTQPSGRFQVTWLDGSVTCDSIPDWLTEEWIVSQLPSRRPGFGGGDGPGGRGDSPRPWPTFTDGAGGGESVNSTIYMGKNSNNSEVAKRLNSLLQETSVLNREQKAIVEYLGRKGEPFTRRDLQRSSLPELKGLTAPEIGLLLNQLEELGEINQARGIYWR